MMLVVVVVVVVAAAAVAASCSSSNSFCLRLPGFRRWCSLRLSCRAAEC